MRKIFPKVNIVFIITIFLLIFAGVLTYSIKADENGSLFEEYDKTTQNIYSDDLKQGAIDLYNFGKEISNQSKIPITLQPTNPSNTQVTQDPYQNGNYDPNDPTNPQITRNPSINGNLTMYRQTDYTQNLPGGCTIAYAGCGPVAAANIITYFTGQQINPVDVASKYTGVNLANCDGSSPNGSANVLASYGFRTKLLFAAQHLTINEAAEKLLPYIKQGNVIHAGGQFYYLDKDGIYQTSGHFFVILDIKKLDNGDYDFIGLDSAYGNRNVIPVSYRKLGQLLYVKHAVSVSR